jgi:hypothetical protein
MVVLASGLLRGKLITVRGGNMTTKVKKPRIIVFEGAGWGTCFECSNCHYDWDVEVKKNNYLVRGNLICEMCGTKHRRKYYADKGI